MGGTGVHLAAGMLASILAARILGPARFGELSVARSTLFTITLLTGASLGVSSSRAVAGSRVSDPDRTGRIIGLLLNFGLITSALAMVIALALAGPLSRQLGAPQLEAVFTVSAPYIVFASISAVQIGVLTGLEAFRSAATMLAFEGLLTGILIVVAARVSGVAGAVAAMVVAAALAFLARNRVLASACRSRGIVIHHRHVTAELPVIRSLVLPSLVFGFSAPPFAWLARAILARGPHGLAEIGVFSAAYSWGSAILTVPAQVTRPSMPILTSLLAAGHVHDFRRLFRDTLLVAALVATAVALPIILFSPWIMRTYGTAFASGALVLTIVAVSSIIASLSSALRSALVATGRVWGQALQSLLWGATLVGTFFAFREQGAIALAGAYVVACVVGLIAQTVMAIAVIGRRKAAQPGAAQNEAAVAAEGAMPVSE